MPAHVLAPLFVLAPLLAATLTPSAAAAASSLPQWDMGAICGRAAAPKSGSIESRDQCADDERRAMQEAKDKWAGYPADLKDRCVSEASSGGPPSYVELVECINLGVEAARSEKGQPLRPRSDQTTPVGRPPK